MREIEVKAHLRDEQLFLKKAAEKGIVFGDPVEQDDTTFLNGTSITSPDWTIFRLRKQGGKILLTMKYHASDRSRDNHEREVEVSDYGEMSDILGRLGYKPDVRIQKVRKFAHFKDLEVCLDEVKELGAFVEVEKLAADDADPDPIQDELWELLQSLGVQPEDRVHKGYDSLMRAHMGKEPLR